MAVLIFIGAAVF